jgi:hypothetical protein
MAMIFPGEFFEGSLDGICRLPDGSVSDTVQLNLESGPVGFFYKGGNLFIAIEQDAFVPGIICIRFKQGGIPGPKQPSRAQAKASPDAGQAALQNFICVHGLKVDPEVTLSPFSCKANKVYIEITGIADPLNGVDQANSIL